MRNMLADSLNWLDNIIFSPEVTTVRIFFYIMVGAIVLIVYLNKACEAIIKHVFKRRLWGCIDNRHRWSRHTLGKYCTDCKMTYKEWSNLKERWESGKRNGDIVKSRHPHIFRV